MMLIGVLGNGGFGSSVAASAPVALAPAPAVAAPTTVNPGAGNPVTVNAADVAKVASTPVTPSAVASAGWLHTSGSRVVTAAGATFTIKAANWFGLETANCAPHGLWQISLGSALDQIRSMGFNTIRLPFANQCIDGGPPNSIDYNLNPGLRGQSAVQILDAVVAGARVRGLRVILDRHRPDNSSQSALWYTAAYPESVWIRDWVMLANRYRSDPTVIGADLHNEPHGDACWGCGVPTRDWAAAAVRGGNAVLAANPRLLILVEGVENQGGAAGSTWWGGGLADVASHPITLSVAHQLVYSAHDYPSTVYAQRWFSAVNYPANLTSVWNANFGFIARAGTAPVFVGEFGTKLQTTSDKQWLATLVKYLQTSGLGFGYWSYNPDSGDTGGLVGDDWQTPQTAKLTALRPLLGSSTPVPPTPTPTAPTPTPTPTPTTSTPSPGPGSLPSVAWTLQSAWAQGYVAQLTVTAAGGLRSWTVSWPDSFGHAIVNAWGLSCTTGSGRTSCAGSSWAAALAAGQTVTVGLQVDGSGTAPAHPPIAVTAT